MYYSFDYCFSPSNIFKIAATHKAMLYTKDGFPQINEIVKCTVQKIYGNTTFVSLDEYNKEGVLTIAEIAPGRIRNLRDHVVENKVIICKVLRVDEKNNRVDVSLRRVPVPVMRDKLEEVKKEEYSDRFYQDAATELKVSKDELFERTYEVIFDNYETVFEALYDIMLDNKKISIFKKLTKKEQEVFVKLINDKIKPEEVVFKKKFHLTSQDKEGVDLIKEAIKRALDAISYEKIAITYLAAGTFGVRITHDDAKSADKLYDNFKKHLEEQAKKNKLSLEFVQ